MELVRIGLILCSVGQVGARHLTCTVSHNDDKTIYALSADPRAPGADISNWDFSWINGTNFTIADNSGQIPPVLNSRIYSLSTSKCLPGIISIISKNTGVKEEYRTICNATCSGKDFHHGEEGGGSKIWIAVGVTVAVAVILVLAVLAYLCSKRRSNCSQCGGRYLTVKMKPDPTLDV